MDSDEGRVGVEVVSGHAPISWIMSCGLRGMYLLIVWPGRYAPALSWSKPPPVASHLQYIGAGVVASN